jgi:ADP-ribosylglycohydrolase
MVAALRGSARSSAGALAVVRTLPCGLLDNGPDLAAELAVSTHVEPAIEAARIAAAMIGGGLLQASGPAQRGLDTAKALPRDPAVMRSLTPDASAVSALAGGVYAAASFPDDVRQAVIFAAENAGSAEGAEGVEGSAATVAGALLGAINGPERLPTDLVARLELAWPGEVLARDLAQELTGRLDRADEERWWARYPGA